MSARTEIAAADCPRTATDPSEKVALMRLQAIEALPTPPPERGQSPFPEKGTVPPSYRRERASIQLLLPDAGEDDAQREEQQAAGDQAAGAVMQR